MIRRLLWLLPVACAACTSTATVDPSSAAGTDAALRISNIQRIREIEDHRLMGSPDLAGFLGNKDIQTRAAAARAVGRIGDPSLQPTLLSLLTDPTSPAVRQSAGFSLGLLGGAAAETAVDTQLAAESDTATQVALLQALSQMGGANSVAQVTGALASNSMAVQAAAAEAYAAIVHRNVAPSTDAKVTGLLLSFAGGSDTTRATASAYALQRLAGAKAPVDEASVTADLATAQAPTRSYLAKTLGALGTPTAIATLANLSAADPDINVRSAACGALDGSAPAVAALTAALGDPSHAVVVAAVNALGNLGAAAAPALAPLNALFDTSDSEWVRSAVLPVVVGIDPAGSHARAVKGVSDVWSVQQVALVELALVATPDDVNTLLSLATSSDPKLAAAAVGAVAYLSPSLITPAVKPAMLAALARDDWEIVMQVCNVVGTFLWKDFAAPLNARYAAFPGDLNWNARLGIAWALGLVGSAADAPLVLSAVGDGVVIVGQYAAASYQQLTGTDVTAQVRAQNVVSTATPSAQEISSALGSLVLLDTVRGPIYIRMLKDAPLNAANFVGLANSGFYDGLTFHRVVPDWVTQGGDPRADGYGGTAFVRDEVSRVPHQVGTVGVATAGKDTGSSQIFFNDGANLRLDEQYTVFGEIVSGQDAAFALEVGDGITSATVIPGAGNWFGP